MDTLSVSLHVYLGLMGCGCIKVHMGTDSERKKAMNLARKLANTEQQIYIIYEKEGQEYADSFKGWDGIGTIIAIVEP